MAFLIDAYEGWTEEQLKTRCRELVRAVDKYQRISMHLGSAAPGLLNDLPKEWADDVRSLIEAHRDEPSPTIKDER